MSPADGRADRSTGRSGSNAKRGARPAAADAAGAAHPAAPVPGTQFTQMTIPSDYNGAREVQRLIREEVERAGYDPDSQFAIKLALEEALINAIKHGNKLDVRKKVFATFELDGLELEITISDEGEGFDPEKVSDPLNPQNLMKTSGRGIFYMKTFMDQVHYSFHPGGGTSLVMTKNLSKGNGIASTKA